MKKTITIEIKTSGPDDEKMQDHLQHITAQVLLGYREGHYNGVTFSYNYTVVTE